MFLVPMLLWGAIDPRGMWEATSAWQFRDPEANEPSMVPSLFNGLLPLSLF